MSDRTEELTPFEKLVKLALQALIGFSVLALGCALPWWGLKAVTSDPVRIGIEVSQAYLWMRFALRFFPYVAVVAGVAGWGLFARRRYRPAFYVGAIGIGLLMVILLAVLVFTLVINFG